MGPWFSTSPVPRQLLNDFKIVKVPKSKTLKNASLFQKMVQSTLVVYKCFKNWFWKTADIFRTLEALLVAQTGSKLKKMCKYCVNETCPLLPLRKFTISPMLTSMWFAQFCLSMRDFLQISILPIISQPRLSSQTQNSSRRKKWQKERRKKRWQVRHQMHRQGKWYFVTKIVLTYCEKNLFYWSRKSLKIEAKGREFADFFRSLEQFI